MTIEMYGDSLKIPYLDRRLYNMIEKLKKVDFKEYARLKMKYFGDIHFVFPSHMWCVFKPTQSILSSKHLMNTDVNSVFPKMEFMFSKMNIVPKTKYKSSQFKSYDEF